MRQVLILITALAIAQSCSSLQKSETLADITKDSERIIKSNLEFLASDDLEGREATKRGARIASDYIASQLKQYGVKPFGDNGTYFQNFKMSRSLIKNSSAIQLTDTQNNDRRFSINKSFVAYSAGDSVMAHAETELLFVGFGITDTTYNYDDYAGLDVAGKTVVFVSGEPEIEGDSLFFNGKKSTRWSRSRAKRKLALEKGAAGAILIIDMKWIKKWTRLNRFMDGEKIMSISKKEKSLPAIIADTLLAKELFSYQKNYSRLLADLKNGVMKPGMRFPFKLKWDLNFVSEIVNARNVVGILPGTEKGLEHQLVTVGAHYDHLGIRDGKIYNGADDNGSGTVSILESARQVAALKSNKRPIVYTFFTAEEKGLKGAYYFTENFARFDEVIVNINIDMVGRESADSIFVVGSGKISGEFFDIVEEANKETANFVFDYTLDDEGHPSNIYYRSDHWTFAKKGVPVVFLTDEHETDYHKPTDDVEKINFAKINKAARLTTQIALKVANLDHKLTIDNANISGATQFK